MRTAVTLALASCLAALTFAQDVKLPLRDKSTRFAVLGDTGTGGREQADIGRLLDVYRQKVKFEFVLLLGDNIYGSERPQDFVRKFEAPYKATLDAGVKFYAALGNHDDPNQRFYKPFNMNGERYYTFEKDKVGFFALDTNYLDRKQLEWVEKALRESKSDWKVVYFHHPLYSSGARHGSEVDLRAMLEPLFTQYGVDIVFAGHEHFYERIKPQKGVYYFTNGGAAKLREGNIRETGLTEKGFDTDQSFMIVEIDPGGFHFQTITRTGMTVDSGSIPRTVRQTSMKPAAPPPRPVSGASQPAPR